MKLNGKYNIVTSEDVVMAGKTIGKNLTDVINEHETKLERLSSNDKWLYKYGGFGSGTGGSGGYSDNWSIYAAINGQQIKSGNIISLYNSTSCKLEISINKPNAGIFNVTIGYEGKTQRNTLDINNSYSWNITLPITKNGIVSITVRDGNNTTQSVNCTCVVNPYDFSLSFVNSNGVKYDSVDNDIFINTTKLSGLQIALNYDIAVDGEISYKINNTFGIETTSGTIDNKSGVIYFPVSSELLSDENAGYYSFNIIYTIALQNQKHVTLSQSLNCNLIPNGLYLKVIPQNSIASIYSTSQNETYTEYLNVINRINEITADIIENGSTPEKEANLSTAEAELSEIKTRLYTFNKGVVGLMVQIYDGQNLSRSNYYLTATNTNDSGTSDVTMSFSQYTERQYYSVNIIANDNSIGENIIEFTLKRGSTGEPSLFRYYYYINNEGSSLVWYDNTPSADNHFRPQDVTSLFSKYANNNFIQMKANMNTNNVLFDTSTLPSTVNILPNNVNDVMISFGIQYSEINNVNNELITISAGSNLEASQLKIYQDKVTLGSGTATNAPIYIPKESEYAVDDYSKYHLITIYKRFVKRYNNDNYYEICIYIDGVIEQAFDSYVRTEVPYTSIILNPGNYSLNMVEMSYFNNTTPINETTEFNLQGMDDTAISQYWYKYCELYRNRNGYNETFVKLLPSLKQMHENADGMMEVTNASVITDIATNVDVPVILLNRKLQNNENFITWLSQSYEEAQLPNAGKKEVTIQYSPGKSSLVEYSIPAIWGNSTFYIELQGSSTGRYKSKNLNLGIDSDSESYKVLFTPNFKNVTADMSDEEKKEAYNTYLPEDKFTMKSDTVDSTHSNNTAIGAFVNMNTTKFEKFDTAIGNYSGYIKNCLLGFPILVFLSLTDPSGEIKYYYLGIYNFNLGRDSYFNMGYIKNSALNNIERMNSQNGTLDDGFNICAIPIGDYILSDTLTIAEIQGGEPYYDFSQFDSSILFPLTDLTHQTDSACMFGDFVPSTTAVDRKILVEGTIKTFVEKVSKSGGYLFTSIGKHMDNSEDNYSYGYNKSISDTDTTLSANQVPNYRMQYKRTLDAAGKNVFTYDPSINVTQGTINDLMNLILADEEAGTEPMLDYRSCVEYYDIAMAFGLIDSVLKNLNIKCWNALTNMVGGNRVFTGKFNIAFYDMDTGLGRSNSGAKVAYFAFSDYWISKIVKDTLGNNVPSPISIYRDFYPERTANNNIPIGYDIPSTYLFAIAKYAQIFVNDDLVKSVTPENLWAQWRNSKGELRNAKYFIDKYFVRNLDEIPESLFGANYRTKYLIQSGTVFDSENKMPFHGRGIYEVTDWLDGRLHILDAYFNIAKTTNTIQTLVYDENNKPTVWQNMQIRTVVDGIETVTNINAPEPSAEVDSTNEDIYVLQDIFGGSTPKKYSSTISTSVRALEYSPLIMKLPQQNVKYLLEDPNVNYLITYKPTGSVNILFGGSKLWTYISSINSLIDENNNLSISSIYLENLIGTAGTCTQWALNMPSLRDVSLTSSNYSGDLVFKIDETTSKDSFPNLTSINISGSKIKLTVQKEGVQTINASNVTAEEISITECEDLTSVNLNNSTFTRCNISPVWSNNISINNANITELTLSGKSETLDINKITIRNNDTITKLTLSNFSDIEISGCPNLKTIILGDPEHIKSLKLIEVFTNKSVIGGYLQILENESQISEESSILDLSKFVNLKTLSLEKSQGFTSLNIQSGISLETRALSGTSITTIDLYKNELSGDEYVILPDNYDKQDNEYNEDAVLAAGAEKYFTGLNNLSEGYIILNGSGIFSNTKYAMKSSTGGINRMVVAENVTSIAEMFKYDVIINGQSTTETSSINTSLVDAFLHSNYICKYENIENINSIYRLFYGQNISYSYSSWCTDLLNDSCHYNSRLSLGRFVNVTDASEVYRRNRGVIILSREMFIWNTDTSGNFTTIAQNVSTLSITNLSVNFTILVENAFHDIIDKLQYFIANGTSISFSGFTIVKKTLEYYGENGPETIKLANIFKGERNGEEIYPKNIRGIYHINFNDKYNNNKVTLDFNKLFDSNWTNLETITNSFGGYGVSYISNFTNVDADENAVDVEGVPVTGIGLRLLPNIRTIVSSFGFNNIDKPIDYYNFVDWGKIYSTSSTGLSVGETCIFHKYITRENLYTLTDIMAGKHSSNNINSASLLNYVFKNLMIIIDNANDNELKLSDVPTGKLSNVGQAISMFENCSMITLEDFNNGIYTNKIPMHLSVNTMKDLPNVTDIRSIFSGIIIDSNLPVNFFNKRKTKTTKTVYCGIKYNYKLKAYDFTNYVTATLTEYEYNKTINNISEALSNIKIYGNTYFDDLTTWENTNTLVAEDGNTYTEYWERLSGQPIQFSNGTLNGAYDSEWQMFGSDAVAYRFVNNPIKCGKENEQSILQPDQMQYAINNVCTHLILPPDILWGCTPTCNCTNVFANSYFEGIIPCQLMRYVQNSQNLSGVFNNLNVIPNYCMTISLTNNDITETNNIYVYIPKGFISNMSLNGLFTFNMNVPKQETQNADGITYDSYYILSDESIGTVLGSLQNALPQNQYQIVWRTNDTEGINHTPNTHDLDIKIHYNIMININDTLYNLDNTDTSAEDYVERIMSEIVVDGIDCNKFIELKQPISLVNNNLAAILYGHIFKKNTFDAYMYDINGTYTTPVISVGNRSGMELSRYAILPSASSTINKYFINITGRGNNSEGNQFNSLWNTNFEDNIGDAYISLWNSSRSYQVNVFDINTNSMLTLPISSRPQ